MTPVVRRGCGLLALMGALAHAQSPATPQPALPAAATSDAPPYEDRVIEGMAPLAPDDLGSQPYDRSGWPRVLRLETRLGTQPFDAQRDTRLGYALYGLLETPNHGVLSIEGSVTPGENTHSLTLRQRELPLPGGWVAHHGLGVLAAPANGLMRLPSRVLVPTANLLGLSGEWEHAASGLSLLAASGEPGQLSSLPTSGFQGLGGRRSVIGGQWHIGLPIDAPSDPGAQPRIAVDPTAPLPALDGERLRGWTLALQHEHASGLATGEDTGAASPTESARATLVNLRHDSAERHSQVQFLRSRQAGLGATGFWADVDTDDGPRRHGLSIYRLEPGLGWAGLAMPGDLQGATLRSEWRTRQWSAEGSYDWLRSISGRAADGSYASASARWRLSRSTRVSAGASVRRFDGNAWSSYLDGRWQNGWGTSGLRLQLAGGSNAQGATHELSYDQEWAVPLGWSVSSSLGIGRYAASRSSGDPAGRFWSGALALSAPVGPYASLRGQLGSERADNGQSRHNLNLGGQWRLSARWSVESSYTRALGSRRLTRPLDPLAPLGDETETTSDRSFQAVLRYEHAAGSRSVPLGGRASAGGGRIEGTVFFDSNRSGVQEASESGVAGVTVTLDNRYAVRTDAQGRFRFPFVASGTRTVAVRNETLPLPWGVVDEGQARVDVRLRETTDLVLPVQRAD